jgi:hypothetical protein
MSIQIVVSTEYITSYERKQLCGSIIIRTDTKVAQFQQFVIS